MKVYVLEFYGDERSRLGVFSSFERATEAVDDWYGTQGRGRPISQHDWKKLPEMPDGWILEGGPGGTDFILEEFTLDEIIT